MKLKIVSSQQRGAALIEFVLLLGLFFMLVVAVVDIAVLMRVSYNISEASRHGSRSAGALWSGGGSCPSISPVSAPCNDVSSITDATVAQVADATCTYIELAGLRRADWTFSFETIDRPWSGDNGTSASTVRIGKVRIDQSGAQQCLFCWQAVLQTMNLSAQSNFNLERQACLAIS